MGEERDTDLIRIKIATKKKLQRIVFNSKQNDNKEFENISRVIDYMFDCLKDKAPLKGLLK